MHGLGPSLQGLGPGLDGHPLYQACTALGQVRMVSGQVLMPPPRPIRYVVSVAVAMGKKQEHSRGCCRLVLFYDAPEELEQLVNSCYGLGPETIA